MSWRVVLVSQILPVAQGFHAAVAGLGHEPVALLTMVDRAGRYDSAMRMDLSQIPPELDILVPARRSSIAPLLRSMEPDLVVCMAFPWKIPPDALAVPTHGWINGHPSLLPRHRGPTPVAWAIRAATRRSGSRSTAWTPSSTPARSSRSARIPLGEPEPPDDFFPKLGPVVGEALVEALPRLASGDEGDVAGGGPASTRRSSPPTTRGSTSRVPPPRCTGSCGRGATG